MLVLDRKSGLIEHRRFFEITEFLKPGDVLVFNESRVIPARLFGKRAGTGGKVEMLLLKKLDGDSWEALVKPGKKLNTGAVIDITDNNGNTRTMAQITGIGENGIRILKFPDAELLPELGKIALPPYIHTPLDHAERYQTVYARENGSVAAPTAGLHFTPELLAKIKDEGVISVPITLHVGLDTFQPVREEDPRDHIIHREFGVISDESAAQISQAVFEGRRVVCVGTTAMRTLEHAGSINLPLNPFSGWIDLFIIPGYQFRVVNAMLTNFHLPRTTLMMLVSAFAGKDLIKKTYAEAIKEKYRFYSFGDAMLIL